MRYSIVEFTFEYGVAARVDIIGQGEGDNVKLSSKPTHKYKLVGIGEGGIVVYSVTSKTYNLTSYMLAIPETHPNYNIAMLLYSIQRHYFFTRLRAVVSMIRSVIEKTIKSV